MVHVNTNTNCLEIARDPVVIDIDDAVNVIRSELSDYLNDNVDDIDKMFYDDYCKTFNYLLDRAKFTNSSDAAGYAPTDV
jgi:hypothetical protein